MKHFMLRGLLLGLVILVGLTLPANGRLETAISMLRAGQGETVLADPTVPALTGDDSEPVTFSETAFPREREVVRQVFADDIRHAEQIQSPVGSVRIEIGLVDLSLSGRKDILAFLEHITFCGSAGCRFVVLIATPDSRWKIGLDGANIPPGTAVRVSRHLTQGFRDILFERHSGSYAAWRWDGERYQWSGTVIRPDQPLAERKWSEADRQRLFAYIDTHDTDKVLRDPAVRARLQRLLGPMEIDNLKSNLEVRGPIGIMDGVLFIRGNAPHRGNEDLGLLAINLHTDGVYAALYTRGKIRIYGRDERIWKYTFDNLPAVVQEWVLSVNSTYPIPMPRNVELHFGPP